PGRVPPPGGRGRARAGRALGPPHARRRRAVGGRRHGRRAGPGGAPPPPVGAPLRARAPARPGPGPVRRSRRPSVRRLRRTRGRPRRPRPAVAARRVRIVGPGRAGSSLSRALGEAGGWDVLALLGRGDDLAGAATGVARGVGGTPGREIAGGATARSREWRGRYGRGWGSWWRTCRGRLGWPCWRRPGGRRPCIRWSPCRTP